jgi:hypothetical protein
MDKYKTWNRFFAGQYWRHGWTTDAMAGRRLAARRSFGWRQAKRRRWRWPAEGSTKEGGWSSAAHRGEMNIGTALALRWCCRRQRPLAVARFDGREQRQCKSASTQKVVTVLSSPQGRKYHRWWRGRAQLHPAMALQQQPTGEAKMLCSAWHRRKGTAALGSGYAAAVRQSSWTMLHRTVVGGGEQPWQSGEWPLGRAKDVLNWRIRPQRRMVLPHLCMVPRWEKGSDVWASTIRKWGRQVGPTRQRIFQIKNTPKRK